MMGVKTVDRMKTNERGVVQKISAKGILKKRLMELGIMPGKTILLKRIAPLGDPVDIEIDGFQISIRKQDAKFIEVEI